MRTITISYPNGNSEDLSIQDALTTLTLALGNEGRRLEAHEGEYQVFTMQANAENTGPWRDEEGRYAPAGE